MAFLGKQSWQLEETSHVTREGTYLRLWDPRHRAVTSEGDSETTAGLSHTLGLWSRFLFLCQPSL